MSSWNTDKIKRISNALSRQRFERYLTNCDGDMSRALELYRWNIEVSAECLKLLHVCEVTFRNAVSDALEAQYGENWPSVKAFQVSLPNPKRGWNPRRDVESLSRKFNTSDQVGKLIADSKFALWCKLMNASQNDRIWVKHFRISFPYAPLRMSTNDERQEIMDAVTEVRELRNRIAHHEPIFTREKLEEEIASAYFLIGCRCRVTEEWCRSNDRIQDFLTCRP